MTSVPNLVLQKIKETKTTITLAWTLTAEQEGYIPLIDDQEKLTDGKRHPSTSQTVNQVTIGKPNDGKTHIYGVKVLGAISQGNYSTTPPPTGRAYGSGAYGSLVYGV